MGKNIVRELLKRPIAYHPTIAKAFGSVKLAILWSQLYYWSDKTKDPEGWVYKTRDELYQETGLKRREQENARKLGRKLGILEEKTAGSPPIVHFKVNLEKTAEVIGKHIEKEDPEDTKVEAKKSNLPDWLDKEVWERWEQHRKEIRKKLTPTTIKSQLRMLEKHKANHVEIIEKSIQNGWTGLFEITDNRKKPANKLESKSGKYANVGEKA